MQPPAPMSRRRVLTIVAGFALLLVCGAGTTAGYVWYDRATRPDRTSPEGVVERYMSIAFDQRDRNEAKFFECDDMGRNDLRDVLLADVEERERRWSIVITVRTARYDVSTIKKTSTVVATIRIDVPEADGKPSTSTQTWKFTLRDEDGWRVCSTERVS